MTVIAYVMSRQYNVGYVSLSLINIDADVSLVYASSLHLYAGAAMAPYGNSHVSYSLHI